MDDTFPEGRRPHNALQSFSQTSQTLRACPMSVDNKSSCSRRERRDYSSLDALYAHSPLNIDPNVKEPTTLEKKRKREYCFREKKNYSQILLHINHIKVFQHLAIILKNIKEQENIIRYSMCVAQGLKYSGAAGRVVLESSKTSPGKLNAGAIYFEQ